MQMLSFNNMLQLQPQEHRQPLKQKAVNLCQSCATIFSGADVSFHLESRSGLKVYRMRWGMIQAAIQGCEFCRRLLPTWAEESEKYKEERESTDKKLKFSFQISPKAANQIVASGHRQLGHPLRICFDISTTLDDPASTVIPYRTINNEVNSEQIYSRIREWLEHCDRSHTECGAPAFESKATLLPSHLIVVHAATDSTNLVHLESTEGVTESVQYSALSYCWGDGQKHVTTMHSYATYLDRIEVCTLPKSIQDAIHVTRKLGLRYLWVDALCIVQDAGEGKHHELGRMQYIYNNAYVVIIASIAASCDDGFLEARDFKRPPLRVPFGSASGHVYLQTPLTLFGIYEPENPIDTRAWTFQEQFLSRRVLYFGRYQLTWWCGTLSGRDGGSLADGSSESGSSFSCRTRRLPKPSDWVSVAHTYSRRALSYPCDKLLALSSVAEYFSAHTGHRYVAGLWLEQMPYQLCWRSSSSSSPGQIWRAPSWTWMSVDGSIWYPGLDTMRFDPPHLAPEILSCQTTPLYDNVPFGQVTTGYLDIRGRVLCCHTAWNMDSEGTRRFWIKDFISSKAKNMSRGGELDFDSVSRPDNESCASPEILTCQGKEPGEGRIFCLLLCRKQRIIPGRRRDPGSYGDYGTPDIELWLPFGLALRRLQSGEFYRVGLFSGKRSSLNMFAKVNSQTIRII
ncbi:heterokaryon incompatibility protein-domain-containing protein [Paraphoma chrysanthemicola]|nr:heterokaryon incompatibility protein-domain-containing protein [Paraphoma chrysanthemicola]